MFCNPKSILISVFEILFSNKLQINEDVKVSLIIILYNDINQVQSCSLIFNEKSLIKNGAMQNWIPVI